MNANGLRARVLRREMLCGTFIKTPAIEIIEVLAHSGLDFICLDAEHAPFDRARLDACVAMARALDFPCLVRVPEGTPAQILMTLDMGATGIVVPHVWSLEKAEAIAKASRFGRGGRGYAGSTRFAGYATKAMSEVLPLTEDTVVIGMIEEPEGVDVVEEIAAVDGIDGLFAGPADLAVGYGKNDMRDPVVVDAVREVGTAALKNGKSAMTFAPDMGSFNALRDLGMTTLFFASEQAWMLQGARKIATEFKEKTT